MKKVVFIIVIFGLLVGTSILGGCMEYEKESHSFLCGDVTIDVIQKSGFDGDDEMRITFFKEGVYRVHISPSPFERDCYNFNIRSLDDDCYCCGVVKSLYSYKIRDEMIVNIQVDNRCDSYIFN